MEQKFYICEKCGNIVAMVRRRHADYVLRSGDEAD